MLFGGVWAIIQMARGDITDPATLASPVLFCGMFGAILWGVRARVRRFQK